MIEIIYLIIGTGIGGTVAYFMAQQKENQKLIKDTEKLQLINEKISKASEDLRDKEREGSSIINNAKNEALTIKSEVEKDKIKLESKLESLEDKDKDLDKKFAKVEEKEEKLENQKKEVEVIKKDYLSKKENFDSERVEKLEQIANLKEEEARKTLLNEVEERSKDILLKQINKVEGELQDEFNQKAQKAIALAVQKFAGEVASESTVTIIDIGSDDLKGKVIGREGRNINSLERATGVDIIIDDTPGSILISGFDLLRRYIAKKSLEKLIEDGRIHPARIEEVVEKVRAESNLMLKDLGQKALNEMGITGIHPDLIKILGRLRFRTSYGQNILKHSMEVGHICGMLAGEIGMDAEKAKMAGFFHDIGKAVDHEVDGTHAVIGYEILKKYNIPEDIAHAVGAHHEEMPIESALDFIVCAADMISGARPGARRESMETYVKRLKQLEDIAGSFDGVVKAYAIQAGREVRVLVEPEKIDDYKAKEISLKITKKIEDDMSYPGQIKVNVIRETRNESFAK